MPFTPAHAAIVLPLLKKEKEHFSATALVIGSFVPDFEYFLRMGVEGRYGHTIGGVFFFDLPLVLVLSLLFHGVVKRNLIRNLPAYYQRRYQDLLQFNCWKFIKHHPLLFVTSALIGIASHLFWDAYTHGNGYFVKALGYQHVYVFRTVHLWTILQHMSSLVGLSLIFLFIRNRPIDTAQPVSSPRIAYWLTLIAIMVTTIVIRFSVRADYHILANFVITVISAGCVGLLIAGLVPFKPRKPIG